MKDFKEMIWTEALDLLKTSKSPYFLMFFTSWCPDSKMMNLLLKKTVNKYSDLGVNFIKVDAEAAKLFRQVNQEWQVLKVPAFYLINGNNREFLGYEYVPIPTLEHKIESVINQGEND